MGGLNTSRLFSGQDVRDIGSRSNIPGATTLGTLTATMVTYCEQHPQDGYAFGITWQISWNRPLVTSWPRKAGNGAVEYNRGPARSRRWHAWRCRRLANASLATNSDAYPLDHQRIPRALSDCSSSSRRKSFSNRPSIATIRGGLARVQRRHNLAAKLSAEQWVFHGIQLNEAVILRVFRFLHATIELGGRAWARDLAR